MQQHRQQVRAGDPHTQRRDGFHGSRRTRGGSDGRIGHCDNSLSMEGESRDSCHLNRSESRPRLSISPAPSANTVRSACVFHVFPGPVRPDRTGEAVVALTSTLLARHIAGRSNPLKTKGSCRITMMATGANRYPQRGGYERQLPQEQTANPSNVYLLIINLNFRYSNDSRLLPVDTRAVLLLSVIFMRLMAETTCDE